MFYTSVVFGIDSSHLGRLDYASLNQQAVMEILIQGINTRDVIRGSAEEPKDIVEWKSVKLNENKEVIEIDWAFYDLEGTLNFQWFPSAVKEILLWHNQISGEIDLTLLPPPLELLDLLENRFSGSQFKSVTRTNGGTMAFR